MQNETHIPKYNIHKILAHSYFIYFLFFLIGVFLDLYFNIRIFNNAVMAPIGVAFLLLATILILWAQMTSRNLSKQNITKETFCKGPYCYTRSPTHWGLFLLLLGFGFIANAFFVIILTLISFVITKFIFLEKEENALAMKYGAPYLEYKKEVKL